MEFISSASGTFNSSHGTFVSGVIAGRDMGGDVALLGTAPEAKIFVYRVAGSDGSFRVSTVMAGLERLVYDRPDIVNISLGAPDDYGLIPGPTHLLSTAVNSLMLENPYIVFVVAAGNDGLRTDVNSFYTVPSPANATLAIAVGSADVSRVEQNGGVIDLIAVSDFSSKGPVPQSFEIKPDILAHGRWIYSTMPGGGYDRSWGTSYATPQIAGAAAILIEYSRINASGTWSSEEVKARLMNTAVHTHFDDTSVFQMGAGYLDVFAAAHSKTVVFVYYDKVATQAGESWDLQDFVTVRTGSFSFGGRRLGEDGVVTRTLTAAIVNNSSITQTYTIEYNFINNRGGAASITFSSANITVEPGAQVKFDVTFEMLAELAVIGFYDGIIYVRKAGGELAATLPFGFVNPTFYRHPMQNVRLTRPVITNSTYAQNQSSHMLGIYFNHYPHDRFRVFSGEIYLYRVEHGRDRFVAWLGSVSLETRPCTPGMLRHYIILNTNRLLAEGEYVINIRPSAANLAPHVGTITLPFYVDNTPPTLNVDITLFGGNNVLVRGNVQDAWMNEAAQEGLTFDIWEIADPNGVYYTPQVDESFIGLWVYATGGEPVRVDVDSNGDFEIIIEDVFDALAPEIVIWAIDNYSLIPVSGDWPYSPYFTPNGFLLDPRFPGYVWAGLNMVEYRRAIPHPDSAVVRFHFDGRVDEVELTLGQRIDPAQIPVPATRYGRIGTPGQVFMGWFVEENPIHYINSPNRAAALNVGLPITEAMFLTLFDENGVLNLHGSWVLYGDVNGDGRVNSVDVAILNNYLAHRIRGDQFIRLAADVNVDGNVNSIDVMILNNFLAHRPVILGPVDPNSP